MLRIRFVKRLQKDNIHNNISCLNGGRGEEEGIEYRRNGRGGKRGPATTPLYFAFCSQVSFVKIN